jgi:serine O-acetyltransferase
MMTRLELAYYLDSDRISLGVRRKKPRLIGDDIWKYQRALRYYEYWISNSSTKLSFFPRLFWRYRYYKLALLLNFEIPPFVAGPGLSLAHRGPIIVNPFAKLGKNCRIHSGVNIGTSAGTQDKAPQIGDNCYIGPGAKLFGAIQVADGIAVAAQAVVNRTFSDPNITIGGIPAKVISQKGAIPYLIDGAGTSKMAR